MMMMMMIMINDYSDSRSDSSSDDDDNDVAVDDNDDNDDDDDDVDNDDDNDDNDGDDDDDGYTYEYSDHHCTTLYLCIDINEQIDYQNQHDDDIITSISIVTKGSETNNLLIEYHMKVTKTILFYGVYIDFTPTGMLLVLKSSRILVLKTMNLATSAKRVEVNSRDG